MQNDGSLTTGALVTVPASYRVHGRERRQAVVESISANGLWFADTTGVRHYIGDAELVPLAEDSGEVARTA
jgi:hypothetical protein